MSTRRWLDVDGSWTNTANWSGGAAPATGDTAIIDEGSQDIVTNVDVSASVKNLHVITGPNFRGSLGSESAPFKFGSTDGSGTLLLNSPLAKGLFLYPTDVDQCIIMACNRAPFAVYLMGGTIDDIYCVRGTGIKIGAAVTMDNLWLYRAPQSQLYVYVMGGATYNTSVQTLGGYLRNEAAFPATVNVGGGLIDHCGDTYFNAGTVTIWAGRFNWIAKGGTVTKFNVRGGYLDASADASPKTATDGEVWEGGNVNLDNGGMITQTNPWLVHGGNYRGLSNPTVMVGPMGFSPMPPGI